MQISGSHFIPIELESLAGSPRKLCFLHFVNDPSLHPKYEQLCSKILVCFIGSLIVLSDIFISLR